VRRQRKGQNKQGKGKGASTKSSFIVVIDGSSTNVVLLPPKNVGRKGVGKGRAKKEGKGKGASQEASFIIVVVGGTNFVLLPQNNLWQEGRRCGKAKKGREMEGSIHGKPLLSSSSLAALISYAAPKNIGRKGGCWKGQKGRIREGSIHGKPLLLSSVVVALILFHCLKKTLTGREEVCTVF